MYVRTSTNVDETDTTQRGNQTVHEYATPPNQAPPAVQNKHDLHRTGFSCHKFHMSGGKHIL